MKPQLKPLATQVVVITGATSGIGLATARTAAARGAAVLLVSRSEPALRALVEEIRALGGRADYRVADVADPVQVEDVALQAQQSFDGFDTWINDAATAAFGRIEDIPLEDQRRLFDVTYWGVVHGSLTAVEHLKGREGGGALINVSSVLADHPLPLQGVYSAAKHAVKGFTNALRMELIRSDPSISVTLIKPSAIDTPYKQHARNYLGHPATNPPPIYDPQLVAEAILYAAEHRMRELTVGGGGRLMAVFAQLAPGLAEPIYAWAMPLLQSERASVHGDDSDNLDRPGRDLQERSGTYRSVRRSSLYTRAQMNPQVVAGVAGSAALAFVLTLAARNQVRLARAKARGRTEERSRWKARQGERNRSRA